MADQGHTTPPFKPITATIGASLTTPLPLQAHSPHSPNSPPTFSPSSPPPMRGPSPTLLSSLHILLLDDAPSPTASSGNQLRQSYPPSASESRAKPHPIHPPPHPPIWQPIPPASNIDQSINNHNLWSGPMWTSPKRDNPTTSLPTQPNPNAKSATYALWPLPAPTLLPPPPPPLQSFASFATHFRLLSKTSFSHADSYAASVLPTLPPATHWRVYLSRGSLAFRHSEYDLARTFFRRSCRLEPEQAGGWVERSKLEEEVGDLEEARRVLLQGLRFCSTCSHAGYEVLMIRAVKLSARLGAITAARSLLAQLEDADMTKVWRAVMEGAMMEMRVGNIRTSRRVFKYLMKNVPWYGPIYYEAFRLEEKEEEWENADAIVERGLSEIPKYGPLWFGAMRLAETMDYNNGPQHGLARVRSVVERAKNCISKELRWKVWHEAGQVELRYAQSLSSASAPLDAALSSARRSLAQAVMLCPENLKWKVWLTGGSMEAAAQNQEVARRLVKKAYFTVPEKSVASVFVEAALVEEQLGNEAVSMAILTVARKECFGEWKVWLEAVELAKRVDPASAIGMARAGIAAHRGTGRIWAALVQMLRGADQRECLREALATVPKSGEVWCEAARIHMNPRAPTFDVGVARRYLSFAIQFTPQYGDSFLECMRMSLLQSVQESLCCDLITAVKELVAQSPEAFEAGGTREYRREQRKVLLRQIVDASAEFAKGLRNAAGTLARIFDELELPDLMLKCVNAEPNYGSLWMEGGKEGVRMVMRAAKTEISREVIQDVAQYVAAIGRHEGVRALVRKERGIEEGQGQEEGVDVQFEAVVEKRLGEAPVINL